MSSRNYTYRCVRAAPPLSPTAQPHSSAPRSAPLLSPTAQPHAQPHRSAPQLSTTAQPHRSAAPLSPTLSPTAQPSPLTPHPSPLMVGGVHACLHLNVNDPLLQEVQDIYNKYAPRMMHNRKTPMTPTEAELPYVSWHLERLMTNELGQHEGHLALHVDRPTALPAALTGGNARLDGVSPYSRGSLLLADGAVEIPYGERDVVLMWTEHMHAVIPPLGGAHQPDPRRISFLHYTRRGRKPMPPVGCRVGDATVEEGAAWRAVVLGVRDQARAVAPRARRAPAWFLCSK